MTYDGISITRQLQWLPVVPTIILIGIMVLLYLIYSRLGEIKDVFEDIRTMDYADEPELAQQAGSRKRHVSEAGKAGSDVCGHRIWISDKSYRYCGGARRDHAGYLDETFPAAIDDHDFDGRDISEDFTDEPAPPTDFSAHFQTKEVSSDPVQ